MARRERLPSVTSRAADLRSTATAEAAAVPADAPGVPLASWRPGMAIEAALRHQTVTLRVPLVGPVTLPSRAHLIWYGGVAAFVALEIVEWPTALLMACAKALSDSQHHQVLREVGDALETCA